MAANLRDFHKFGRKIVGVGFNYKSLMKEMGVKASSVPRIYLKAPSSYVTQEGKVKIPNWSPQSIWYEVELGVIIGENLKKASPERALEGIGGYCTALDFTCKDTLLAAREQGLSWAMSKSFDTACAVGDFIPKENFPDPTDVNLWLTLNGISKQKGHSSDMTWSAPQLVSIISQYLTLEPGDLILSGTPSGMGIISPGDEIRAGIEGVDEVRFQVE
ncbi:hypothetical protein CAPTEDRAFT_169184 [Capitella teleta]|uniref:oxaloacetate tautomerase n=1 Tax=Capitella teleta TaxID=283909 RepID=R7VDH9_CAPTE|nr:hypothetical protein CAPTEDRAFT_169184 [Capitella teleta]|eukprot:ELU13720.1 hypothetical protein CAPTEDRAFT_169184 [Capitella teleta]